MDFDIQGSLFPNLTTLITQLLATGVLVYFFLKFLWDPFCEMMAKRATFIEGNINEAKEINEQAKVHIQESERLAKEGAIEYKEIVEKAKEDGQKVKNTIIEEAKKEAAIKIVQADQQIESKKQKVREEMKQEMVDVAFEVAKKVIDKEIDQETNKKLIEDFVNEVEQYE